MMDVIINVILILIVISAGVVLLKWSGYIDSAWFILLTIFFVDGTIAATMFYVMHYIH